MEAEANGSKLVNEDIKPDAKLEQHKIDANLRQGIITNDACIPGLLGHLEQNHFGASIKPMLFLGDNDDSRRGWENFRGFFDSVENAKQFLECYRSDPSFEWAHIVENGEITWKATEVKRQWVWECVKNAQKPT